MFDSISHNSATKFDAAASIRNKKTLILFGTRPEAIKLAPVIHELKRRSFETVVVSSSQHKQLLKPFLRSLDIEVDHDLSVMKRNQSLNHVISRVITKLDKILDLEQPDLILVQGDTTTTLAGALAGFNRKIPVGHIEAGLRSGNVLSPFPEEMNRRLVSQIATLHFAATEDNRQNLLDEGVNGKKIFVTGNPVVDSLSAMLGNLNVNPAISQLLEKTNGKKLILLTTHRRESFGKEMTKNLATIREFVDDHEDVCLLFPVHPNPNVKTAAQEVLGGNNRVHLLEPLDYSDFLALMRSAWLIVSDSGGVQEEAPSLGKPLLILRENTERPEAINTGNAKLVGRGSESLQRLLEQNYKSDKWTRSVAKIANPFGDGKAAMRIVKVIEQTLAAKNFSRAASV